MLKKRFSKTCIVAVIAVCILAGSTSYAAPINTDTPVLNNVNETNNEIYSGNDFLQSLISVYENLSGEQISFEQKNDIPEGILKAISLGLISEEDIENYKNPISKQNAAHFIYQIIMKYDSSFELSADESNFILNSCYDNGKLFDENKIAFAFCLKYGIFKFDTETYPGDALTNEQADEILSRILNEFSKNISFNINDKKITINDTEENLLSLFGNPNRIDKTIYDFSWYVYNSLYSNYFMVGIKEGKICAFYSNSNGVEFGGIKKGDAVPETEIKGLNFYPDENGNIEGILYNPNEIKTYTYNEELLSAVENELCDLINSHRVSNGKMTLNKIDAVNKINVFSESAGQNVQELFYGMLIQKSENPDIINETINTSSDIAIDVVTTDDGGLRAAAATNSGVFGILPDKTSDAAPDKSDYTVQKPAHIGTPKITSIKNGDVLNSDEDVVIDINKSVSDKYFIKIFDVEQQRDVVCQYIVSGEKSFVFQKEIFTPGADYIVEMCSLDGEELNYADSVEFTYGEAINPVSIETPFNNSYTYDSETELFLTSSVYHDFKIEVINEDKENIISTVIRDTNTTILDSIPSGKYTLQVTALMHGTDAERGMGTVSFEVKKVNPEIKTYILNPDEKFNFIYESPDSKYLYFYDEEIIYVDEEVTEIQTETVTDENGQETVIETPVTKTVQSPRKKIIQKKVPATKQYRKLRCMYTSGTYTTGAIVTENSTEKGNAIANSALLYQGIPYVWGGESTSGFDCSGLVKYVCNKLGISVHRTSADQFAYDGEYVLKSQLIPGDLIFFQDNGVIHHVGIYIGDGKMVHAPHTGDVVKVSSINSDYYMREYAGAKRVSK